MIASITVSITTLMFEVLVAVVKWGVICFPLLLLQARNWLLMNSLAASTSWSGPEEAEGMHFAVFWNMLCCIPENSGKNALRCRSVFRIFVSNASTLFKNSI